MEFALTDEQQMIVDTVRSFTERELFPYEDQVEKLGEVPPELVQQIKQRSIAAGLPKLYSPRSHAGHQRLQIEARPALVNHQHRLPFAAHWGEGTTASSDGQRYRAGGQGEAAGQVNAKDATIPA